MLRRLAWPAAASLLVAAGHAAAQDPAANYPARPVRVVVPFPPGGATDILARVVGKRLGDVWAQNFIIDNRAGAGGTIGSTIVARGTPDGYTLLMGTNATHTIAPSLYSKLAYDPIKDFAPITLVAIVPQVVVVHPSIAANNIKDLIALAKAKPGSFNFASAGTGTPGHLGMEMLRMLSGTTMQHVPYQGGAPGLAAVVAGQVQFMADNMNSALPLIKAGKVRAIAVTTLKRSAALPDLSTIAEQALPGFDSGSWFGLLAPAGTPRGILAKLTAEVTKSLDQPDIRATLSQQGAEVAPNTPDQFVKLIRDDIARWAKVAQAAGVKPN